MPLHEAPARGYYAGSCPPDVDSQFLLQSDKLKSLVGCVRNLWRQVGAWARESRPNCTVGAPPGQCPVSLPGAFRDSGSTHYILYDHIAVLTVFLPTVVHGRTVQKLTRLRARGHDSADGSGDILWNQRTPCMLVIHGTPLRLPGAAVASARSHQGLLDQTGRTRCARP